MPLTREQFLELRSKGLSVEQIISFEKGNKPTSIKKTSGLTKAKDVGIGFGKGLVSSFTGASSLGERMLTGTLKTVLPKSAERKLGIEKPLYTTSAEETIPESVRTPTNKAQKVGFIGEQIAEFFIPGSRAIKLGSAASNAVKGSKIVKGLTKLGTTAVTEAGLAGGQTAIQKGKVDKEVGQASILGGVFPVGAKVISKGFKGVAKLGGESIGKMTGTQGDVIKEVFNNPNVIKYTREASKDIGSFSNEVLYEAKEALRKISNVQSKDYQKSLAKIKLNSTQLDSITREARDKTLDLLDQYDIRITPPSTSSVGKKLNELDFSKSVIVKGRDVVERAINETMSWTDSTPAGLDKLKKRLGYYVDQVSSVDTKVARNIILSLKETFDTALKKNVKGYEQMTSAYRNSEMLIDDINRTFSLGNNKMRETALKKIMTSLRENNEHRKELLSILGEAGGKDLQAKVAGVQLAPLAPRGLSGVLTPTIGGAAAILSPANIPSLLAIGLLSSPRIAGELVNLLGQVNRSMIVTNKFSPQLQRAIRELIIKAQQDEE